MFHKGIDNRTIIFEFIDRGYYDENHLAYTLEKKKAQQIQWNRGLSRQKSSDILKILSNVLH